MDGFRCLEVGKKYIFRKAYNFGKHSNSIQAIQITEITNNGNAPNVSDVFQQ